MKNFKVTALVVVLVSLLAVVSFAEDGDENTTGESNYYPNNTNDNSISDDPHGQDYRNDYNDEDGTSHGDGGVLDRGESYYNMTEEDFLVASPVLVILPSTVW